MRSFCVLAPEGIGEIRQGDNIAGIIFDALEAEGEALKSGDIVAIAHKIVSKAEGRVIRLSNVSPGAKALQYAKAARQDPRLIQLILQESAEVLHASRPFICRHRLGFVCANAGVDCSNSAPGSAVLLPLNPDASASAIREGLERRYGARLSVLICDTHGRSLREGVIGVAIGSSGVQALKRYAGQEDRAGRALQSTVEAVGDELASAAGLLMGQAAQGRPVAIVRGLNLSGEGGAMPLVRQSERDILIKNNSNI